MTNWLKWSIGGILATIFAPIFSKFCEKLFEQLGWFDDPQSVLRGFFEKTALVFENTWYQFIAVFIIGFFVGAFLFPILKDRFGGGTTYYLGVDLENRFNDIRSGVNSNGLLASHHPNAFSFENHSQLRSFFVTLEKRGIKTPSVPASCSLVDLKKLAYYCGTIYPLLQDNHLKEAKRESKRILHEINSNS